MFGKKKLPGIRVVHYEGLDFPTDYPCGIEITETSMTITRLSPDVTVTLPITQIKSFSAMEEPAFMLKYHGQAISTTKVKSTPKYYLVVEYTAKDGTDKHLAFWGTSSEYRKFLDLQYKGLKGTPKSYSL